MTICNTNHHEETPTPDFNLSILRRLLLLDHRGDRVIGHDELCVNFTCDALQARWYPRASIQVRAYGGRIQRQQWPKGLGQRLLYSVMN